MLRLLAIAATFAEGLGGVLPQTVAVCEGTVVGLQQQREAVRVRLVKVHRDQEWEAVTVSPDGFYAIPVTGGGTAADYVLQLDIPKGWKADRTSVSTTACVSGSDVDFTLLGFDVSATLSAPQGFPIPTELTAMLLPGGYEGTPDPVDPTRIVWGKQPVPAGEYTLSFVPKGVLRTDPVVPSVAVPFGGGDLGTVAVVTAATATGRIMGLPAGAEAAIATGPDGSYKTEVTVDGWDEAGWLSGRGVLVRENRVAAVRVAGRVACTGGGKVMIGDDVSAEVDSSGRFKAFILTPLPEVLRFGRPSYSASLRNPAASFSPQLQAVQLPDLVPSTYTLCGAIPGVSRVSGSGYTADVPDPVDGRFCIPAVDAESLQGLALSAPGGWVQEQLANPPKGCRHDPDFPHPVAEVSFHQEDEKCPSGAFPLLPSFSLAPAFPLTFRSAKGAGATWRPGDGSLCLPSGTYTVSSPSSRPAPCWSVKGGTEVVIPLHRSTWNTTPYVMVEGRGVVEGYAGGTEEDVVWMEGEGWVYYARVPGVDECPVRLPAIRGPSGDVVAVRAVDAATAMGIPGVFVHASSPAPHKSRASSVTDASGWAAFRHLTEGVQYYVQLSHPEYNFPAPDTVAPPAVLLQEGRQVAFSACGQVVNAATGAPVEGAVVFAAAPGGEEEQAVTGPDGRFAVLALTPNTAYILAVRPGTSPGTVITATPRTIDVFVSDVAPDPVTFSAAISPTAFTLQGTVTGISGDPEGLSVNLHGPKGGVLRMQSLTRARYFEFQGVRLPQGPEEKMRVSVTVKGQANALGSAVLELYSDGVPLSVVELRLHIPYFSSSSRSSASTRVQHTTCTAAAVPLLLLAVLCVCRKSASNVASQLLSSKLFAPTQRGGRAKAVKIVR